MARTLIAHLRQTDVPARKALQEAIDELKFPLVLDDTYLPFETAGYLPCTLNGEDAGFELRLWLLQRPASLIEIRPCHSNGAEIRGKRPQP